MRIHQLARFLRYRFQLDNYNHFGSIQGKARLRPENKEMSAHHL